MVSGAGIADVQDRQVRVGDAAVDVLVFFPEAALELQPHLHGGRVRNRRDRARHRRAHIHGYLRQYGQRNRAQAPIGARRHPCVRVGRIHIGGGDAAIVLPDVDDLRVVTDQGSEFPPECLADPAHPAHRLEQRRLHVVDIAVRDVLPQIRFQQVGQADGFGRRGARAQSSARRLLESAPVAGFVARHVLEVAVERAPLAQRLEQLFLVLLADPGIQGILARRLGEQLRDMALIVGLDLAITLRLAAECAAIVQVGLVIHLYECFERHAQHLAVVEHAPVMVRNAPWARIDVQVLVEYALLNGPAQFGVPVAAAQRPVAPARPAVEFEHLNTIARVAQLIRGRHARHAGAQDQHRRAAWRMLQIDGARIRRVRGEAQRAHGLIHRRAARRDAYHAKQVAAAQRGWGTIIVHHGSRDRGGQAGAARLRSVSYHMCVRPTRQA